MDPTPDTLADTSRKRSNQMLFRAAAIGLAAACLYFSFTTRLQDPVQIGLGLAILVMAAWPAMRWAQADHAHFPAFEIFMLTGISFYAIPMLAGHENVISFTERTITGAALTMLVFQASANIAFLVARGQPARNPLQGRTRLLG